MIPDLPPAICQSAAPAPDAAVIRTLAPMGKLRVSINYGNIVLAQRSPSGPAGVSADIAREIGRRLGVPVEFVAYDAAGEAVDAGVKGAWDVGFLAIEPARAERLDFTAPYVLIEGTYLVPRASRLRTVDDVDAAGVKIGVSQGAAYDLYLTRTLKAASLVRQPGATPPGQLFAAGVDAVAGVRQSLETYARAEPGVRVMDGRFQEIRQAVATPKGRDAAGAAWLSAVVEDLKASGFVASGLARSGHADAQVAPSTR